MGKEKTLSKYKKWNGDEHGHLMNCYAQTYKEQIHITGLQ